MTVSTANKLLVTDRRLVLLRLLAAHRRVLDERTLCAELRAFHPAATLDTVRADLAWLAAHALVALTADGARAA